MRIQTLNRSYEILQRKTENEILRISVAREDGHAQRERFLLVELRRPEDIHRFLLFCEEQERNVPFEDFVEYFSRDGSLYMVFRYYEHSTITQWLASGEIPLAERLRTAKSMFQRMVFLHMPDYFQYEALHELNLMVDESGEVYFNYQPQELEREQDITRDCVWARIKETLAGIFRKELAEKSCPSLEEFLEDLEERVFVDYLEAFREYEAVRLELMQPALDQTIKPRSFWFRLWESLKRLAHYLKYVVIVGVCAALVWYLVYTIVHPSGNGEERINFESIGTLEITSEGER